ncbi:MAG TPA: RNA-binding protein [bacterium]|nr:RNA-binding protein [bacterium]
MGHKIYVGSLPFETTESQLSELFTACGRVENAKIIVDRATGRSRGFGFVEMATALEAEAAIQKFNGSNLGSRTIVVKEARPMEDRRPPSKGNNGGNGGGFKPRPARPNDHWSNGGGGGGNRWGGVQGSGRELGGRSEHRNDRQDRRDNRFKRDQGGWNDGGYRKKGPSGRGGQDLDDNFGNR